ncbi:uncharacterized protein LOC116587186 [Mustela erminea]|uniref:uncharacterized protein LOC116587186 n=1 Tax=Mustela erminea TaxID=36723 RepID=UPI001386D549|nr:uncharacterized protein LOC116587186 [Mustela erminea]
MFMNGNATITGDAPSWRAAAFQFLTRMFLKKDGSQRLAQLPKLAAFILAQDALENAKGPGRIDPSCNSVPTLKETSLQQEVSLICPQLRCPLHAEKDYLPAIGGFLLLPSQEGGRTRDILPPNCAKAAHLKSKLIPRETARCSPGCRRASSTRGPISEDARGLGCGGPPPPPLHFRDPAAWLLARESRFHAPPAFHRFSPLGSISATFLSREAAGAGGPPEMRCSRKRWAIRRLSPLRIFHQGKETARTAARREILLVGPSGSMQNSTEMSY